MDRDHRRAYSASSPQIQPLFSVLASYLTTMIPSALAFEAVHGNGKRDLGGMLCSFEYSFGGPWVLFHVYRINPHIAHCFKLNLPGESWG